jgi:FkbM family methyltransferase
MKKKVINVLKKISKSFFDTLYKARVGRLIIDNISTTAMDREMRVIYNGNTFVFTTPNSLNRWRLDTFSTKEPETLDWIDKLETGSVLWDIGANIGLYSVYAAKIKNCKVYSFEPSVFNLELLARNAFANGLSEKINIVPLPLTDSIGINKLNMTSTAWGGAVSTFGSLAIGHDGKPMKKTFEFCTLGISMDSAVAIMNIPMPDYIKMDVDGIEHIILKGGANVLKNVKGVIIEINDDFEEQGETATRLLLESGLRLREKTHSVVVEHIEEFKRTFNQIWVR